jgi:hypothetical protein
MHCVMKGHHRAIEQVLFSEPIIWEDGCLLCEPGSSVSIVSDYGLDNRAIEMKAFFLKPLCPDRLWGPLSLLYNGYRGSFPRG